MNGAPENHVEALFLAALDLAPSEREPFVAERAGGDGRLREEVLSLLRHHEDSESFLATPLLAREPGVGGHGEVADGASADGAPPSGRFGEYELLGLLGEGGMGIVYLARQRSPARCVALKVLRPGATTPRLLRRFEHEAEVLGRLQHPGIAQIHEADTADAGLGPQPYFAMEWVRGPTLSAYAAEHDLSARERLALLADVCDAVEHAHQNGIVHRDLKSSNILVDASAERPQVKVLDFGVARAVDPDASRETLHTEPGQIVGTLGTMSPEQASGDPDSVDTRADVYALGAVGYELLGGRLPLDVSGRPLHEAVRAVCEEEPLPLGALAPALRGDVETLIAKALEKERSRRYGSAAAFARDIRRHLADLPIEARPPSTIYVASKFARRHRALVLGVAGVILALVLGIAGTATQAWRASQARDRALFHLKEADEARRLEVEQRVAALREAERAHRVSDTFQTMLARALPEQSGREVSLVDVIDRTAADLSIELRGMPAIEADVRQTLGQTYLGLGELRKAERELSASVELRRGTIGSAARETLVALTYLGRTLLALDRTQDAERALDEAVRGLTDLGGDRDPDAIVAIGLRGQLAKRLGRQAEAEADLRHAVAARREFGQAATSESCASMSILGTLLLERGQLEEAESLEREALACALTIDGELHPTTLDTMTNLASVLHVRGRSEEAGSYYRRALEIGRRIQGERHQETLTRMNNLAGLLHSTGELAEAEYLYRTVIDLLAETVGQGHLNTVLARGNLALLLSEQDRNPEAETLSRGALAALAASVGDDDARTFGARYNLARILRREQRFSDALDESDAALRGAERAMPPGHWQVGLFYAGRGACLLEMGRGADAESDLLTAWERLAAELGAAHWRTREVVATLVRLYAALGDAPCEAHWQEILGSSTPPPRGS